MPSSGAGDEDRDIFESNVHIVVTLMSRLVEDRCDCLETEIDSCFCRDENWRNELKS
jgi:hypothetical protein